MRSFKKVLFLITVLSSTCACAITRSDVLECGLSDGSKYILTSKYEWGLLNKLNPHNSSGREGQTPFLIKFQPKNSFNKIEISGSVGYSRLDANTANSSCAAYGIQGNVAYIGLSVYYSFDQKQLFELSQDDKFYISAIVKNRDSGLQEKLDSMKLSVYPGYSAISIIDQKITKERSLEGIEVNTIQAVWQSTSSDNGKTWSAPHRYNKCQNI